MDSEANQFDHLSQSEEVIISPAVAIDIPLDPDARFLPLATTDNGLTYCRWSMFAVPALTLESRP